MLIKTKLRVGSILLALLPAIIASSLIGWNSFNHAGSALKDQAKARLTSLREDRSSQIVSYFKSMKDQTLAFAKDRMTIDAMRKLSAAYHGVASEIPVDVPQERASLKSYYLDFFSKEYAKRNNGQQPDVDQLLAKLGDAAVPMQLRYIKNNPNPLGEKDKLDESQDGTSYSKIHALYHPAFREIQQRYGYYDIFLIDANTGEVVYTVFKELDFATSLKNGPFADSGLAEAYRGAMKLKDDGSVFLTDFEPYVPSYQDPAAFIAAPIFDHGERVGIIAFQLPIDRINNVMTANDQWKESGLGDSGETYLVGPDFTMRSQSRFWVEDPNGFLAAIKAAGVKQDIVDTIEAKKTVIGLMTVRTPGVERAIGGESGFATFEDYRGIPVLSSFKPIDIGGHRWAVLAEEDVSEAYASAYALQHTIIYLIVGASVILLLISGGLGWSFSLAFAKPLERIVDSMRNISSGTGDLTARLDESARDELGELAGAFNRFVEKLDSIMSQVGDSTDELATASEELSMITKDTRQGVEQQQGEIQQVATAIEEMSVTVREVAQNTNATADAARHAGSQVEAGKEVLENSAAAVQKMSNRMNQSREVVGALQQDSTKVGTVLDVIRNIAEQTNLLALNAAIEAARAGDQGRGFAVVADEVRMLAQKTQESTEEIRNIIESLQTRSQKTVQLLQENNEDLKVNVELSEQTQHAFMEIENAMQQLLDMSTQIASATEEQAAVTEEISRNVDNIYQVAQSTASGSEQTEASSQMLARLGDGLKNLVGQFRVSGRS